MAKNILIVGSGVGDVSGIPFGWEASSTYTIKVLTDNGFTTEGTYYTPSNFLGTALRTNKRKA